MTQRQTTPGTPWQRWAVRASWILLTTAVAGFYTWTATSSSRPSDWDWGPKNRQYYNLLTNAFLAGQLHLQVQPSPEILALKDPNDLRGTGYRLQDASLYHGKYYLYFGATPALTLFLPWKIVTGGSMPESFAVLVYATVGWVCLSLLLLQLLSRRMSRLLSPLKCWR